MKNKLFIFLIIGLALLLRLYKLGSFPPTLYGDEQAFAWNAYNILLTGEDEYGTSYPLQFKSFNDYKAPIPVYLLVPFIKVFGLSAFAIRLPVAVASVLTVLITYYLSRLFFNNKISLIISFLMAVSPWHMHLSRGFFEATLALLWFVLGVYFWIRSSGRLKLILIGIIFFTLSLYTYFTPRILLPFFLIFLFFYIVYTSEFSKKIMRNFFLGIVFLLILSLPLIKMTVFDKGFSRFDKLTETNTKTVIDTVSRERYASNLSLTWRSFFHNKITVWYRLVKNNYLEHLSINFWYIYGDNSLRYFTGNMGMFYLLELPFFLIGLYTLWREKRNTAILFIGWILLAPIPATIVGRSFAVRSLSMLPAPFIFVGYGLYKSFLFLSEKLRYRNLFSAAVAIGYTLFLGTLLIRYYLEYPVYAATWWGWENKAAIDYAKKIEPDYDRIFISDFYTGAPLAFAVYTAYDPLEFRKAVNNPVTLADGRRLIQLGKYYFGSLDIDKERLKSGIIPSKSLYIARPEEADSEETINAPDDDRVIFKIYKTH
jgi:4-amino-4-deoxy-L-arabinose transferase-like glycosyltransferase